MLIYWIQVLFIIYTCMILVRVLGSWFPKINATKFMRFIAFYTDPYINLFRRFIPPIGGVLDISPILAFIGLRILESLIIRLLI